MAAEDLLRVEPKSEVPTELPRDAAGNLRIDRSDGVAVERGPPGSLISVKRVIHVAKAGAEVRLPATAAGEVIGDVHVDRIEAIGEQHARRLRPAGERA